LDDLVGARDGRPARFGGGACPARPHPGGLAFHPPARPWPRRGGAVTRDGRVL